MATSLIIESRNDDTTKQKSLTDINPNATDDELKTFAQTLISLTNNSYVKTDRVDKRNLDTDPKPSRNLGRFWCPFGSGSSGTWGNIVDGVVTVTFKVSQMPVASGKTRLRADNSYPLGDSTPIISNIPADFIPTMTLFLGRDKNDFQLVVTADKTYEAGESFEFDFTFPESLIYKEEKLHFVVNIIAD